ncbi:hypothetical protein, partial [Halogeometricum sp. CBA1124]|uniref:hypothetical protein n=1 Tax=Halogeometricum sp. CBA1124 TaxID=2668071 RepID=UPI00142A40C3
MRERFRRASRTVGSRSAETYRELTARSAPVRRVGSGRHRVVTPTCLGVVASGRPRIAAPAATLYPSPNWSPAEGTGPEETDRENARDECEQGTAGAARDGTDRPATERRGERSVRFGVVVRERDANGAFDAFAVDAVRHSHRHRGRGLVDRGGEFERREVAPAERPDEVVAVRVDRTHVVGGDAGDDDAREVGVAEVRHVARDGHATLGVPVSEHVEVGESHVCDGGRVSERRVRLARPDARAVRRVQRHGGGRADGREVERRRRRLA